MNEVKKGAAVPPAVCPVSAIGLSFDAFDGESYSFCARARREEPVFYSPQIGCWVVTRYQDVREILRGDPEIFSASNAIANVKEHLAFGWGRHHCIGDGLARLGIRVALEELSRRLPHMKLVEGQPWEYSPNASHRGPEHLTPVAGNTQSGYR